MSDEQTTKPTHPVGNSLRLGDGSYESKSVTSPTIYLAGSHVIIPPDKVIPILFVPGIMGSNLRLTSDSAGKVKKRFEEEGKGKDFTDESWRPPNVTYSGWKKAGVGSKELILHMDSAPVKLGKKWKSFGPKLRQVMLDPTGTEVDDMGFLQAPENMESPLTKWYPKLRDPEKEARRRGWGTVYWDSYGKFLLWLEEALNMVEINWVHGGPKREKSKDDVVPFACSQGPNTSPLPKSIWPNEQEFKNVQKFQYPVHAVGYNWTQSNRDSAKHLLEKIKEFMGAYKKAGFTCGQVILVSHSMGGLVSRICQKMDKENLILGIVHGVMPATGAPVAYRRLVAGVEGGGDAFLDIQNVFDNLAGRNTYETTPVVANSPGALELLPSHLYPSGWLKMEQQVPQKAVFALPSGDNPYEEIYKQKDAWYRLVNPELLDPAEKYERIQKNDKSSDKAWKAFIIRMTDVEKVHRNWLGEKDYHKNTFVYYGEGQSSFSTIRWQLDQNTSLAAGEFSKDELMNAVPKRDFGDGKGIREVLINQTHPNVGWLATAKVLLQDSTGDGTVPIESGQAPGKTVSTICRLKGFEHQGAYGADFAKDFSLLGIIKLTALSDLAKS